MAAFVGLCHSPLCIYELLFYLTNEAERYRSCALKGYNLNSNHSIYTNTYIHLYIHTYIHTLIKRQIHNMQTYIHAYKQIIMHAKKHTYIHTYIHMGKRIGRHTKTDNCNECQVNTGCLVINTMRRRRLTHRRTGKVAQLSQEVRDYRGGRPVSFKFS